MNDELNKMIPEPERRQIETLYLNAKHRQTNPQPFLCWVGFHHWSKWWVIGKGTFRDNQDRYAGKWVTLKRFCLKCHDVDIVERIEKRDR